MAGHVEMKAEIIQGILGGLVMILVVVGIGSGIGFALSGGHHGPEGEHDAIGGETVNPMPNADPAEGGEAPLKEDAQAGDPTPEGVIGGEENQGGVK